MGSFERAPDPPLDQTPHFLIFGRLPAKPQLFTGGLLESRIEHMGGGGVGLRGRLGGAVRLWGRCGFAWTAKDQNVKN